MFYYVSCRDQWVAASPAARDIADVVMPGADELGRQVGLSRSALHERFVRLVGHPPMQYLANWRMQRGAVLLREGNATVATIAQEVGYDSEAAFARAFKRLVGQPPAAWRRAQRG